MRFLFLVNDAGDVKPAQTTAMLMAVAARQHEVWVSGVDGISGKDHGLKDGLNNGPNDSQIWAAAKRVVARAGEDVGAVIGAIAHQPLKSIALEAATLDILFIRTNPARDLARSGLHSAALSLARLAAAKGVCVLNRPDGLIRAATKLYLLEMPAFTYPPTLVSAQRDQIVEFIEQLPGPAVLKPLQGTRGNDVFFVTSGADQNLNQMIDVILRQGLVMAQGCIPGAEKGDTRVVVMQGEVLEIQGKPAAIQRVPTKGDFRSNLHAGGTAQPGVVTAEMRRVVRAVADLLIRDGLFLVGLDFIGHQLLEINVFSTGGLRDAERFTGQAFAEKIIRAAIQQVRR